MDGITPAIQALLDDAVESGRERGIQVAAYYKGEQVVDAWSGTMGNDGDDPVDGRTLFPVFSTSKGIGATVIHILAEQGRLDYDSPVSEYWPEFGCNGKEAITVRQVLTHSSGIPQMPEDVKVEDLADWDIMCRKVAGLTPIWEPGTRTEYHAITYGWLVGEIARRVGGKPFPDLMNELICEPLGIEDMFMGIPDEAEPRVAILDEPEADPINANEQGVYAIPPIVQPLYKWMNHPAARRTCNPASCGIMSARAIARHYAALVPGGVDGVELISPEHIRKVTRLKPVEECTELELAARRAMGYGNGSQGSIQGSRESAFGHGGYGGSIGFADPEYGFACGLTKNHYSKNGAEYGVVCKIRELLGIPQ